MIIAFSIIVYLFDCFCNHIISWFALSHHDDQSSRLILSAPSDTCVHECITALLRQVNQNFRVYFYVTELELDSRLLVKLKQFMVERGDVRFEYIEDRPMVSRVGRKEGGMKGGRKEGRVMVMMMEEMVMMIMIRAYIIIIIIMAVLILIYSCVLVYTYV